MSSNTQTTAQLTTSIPTEARKPVWKHGVVAAVVASLATTVLAAVALAAGVSFARTAIALTALSFVPDLTFGFDATSAATLITLHTIAAAIMIPTLTRRLAHTR